MNADSTTLSPRPKTYAAACNVSTVSRQRGRVSGRALSTYLRCGVGLGGVHEGAGAVSLGDSAPKVRKAQVAPSHGLCGVKGGGGGEVLAVVGVAMVDLDAGGQVHRLPTSPWNRPPTLTVGHRRGSSHGLPRREGLPQRLGGL